MAKPRLSSGHAPGGLFERRIQWMVRGVYTLVQREASLAPHGSPFDRAFPPLNQESASVEKWLCGSYRRTVVSRLLIRSHGSQRADSSSVGTRGSLNCWNWERSDRSASI